MSPIVLILVVIVILSLLGGGYGFRSGNTVLGAGGPGFILQGESFFAELCDIVIHGREVGCESQCEFLYGLCGSIRGCVRCLLSVSRRTSSAATLRTVCSTGGSAQPVQDAAKCCTEQPRRAKHGLTSCWRAEMGFRRVTFS